MPNIFSDENAGKLEALLALGKAPELTAEEVYALVAVAPATKSLPPLCIPAEVVIEIPLLDRASIVTLSNNLSYASLKVPLMKEPVTPNALVRLTKAAEKAASAVLISVAVFVVPDVNAAGSPVELNEAAIAFVTWLTFAVPAVDAKE
jgi:hypothetical protein